VLVVVIFEVPFVWENPAPTRGRGAFWWLVIPALTLVFYTVSAQVQVGNHLIFRKLFQKLCKLLVFNGLQRGKFLENFLGLGGGGWWVVAGNYF